MVHTILTKRRSRSFTTLPSSYQVLQASRSVSMSEWFYRHWYLEVHHQQHKGELWLQRVPLIHTVITIYLFLLFLREKLRVYSLTPESMLIEHAGLQSEWSIVVRQGLVDLHIPLEAYFISRREERWGTFGLLQSEVNSFMQSILVYLNNLVDHEISRTNRKSSNNNGLKDPNILPKQKSIPKNGRSQT